MSMNEGWQRTTKPAVGELVALYRRCSPAMGAWNRLGTNDEVRYAVWDGQSADGRKHGKDAKPWDQASDTRILLADDVCNDLASVCEVAFWRGLLRMSAVEAGDLGGAQQAAKILRWYVRQAMYAELVDEVELSAQYLQHYGWCVLHPVWVREVSRKLYRVTLEDLREAGMRAGDGGALAEMILDPAQEDAAAEQLGQLYEVYLAGALEGIEREELPELSLGRRRAMVRELRETGETEAPLPYLRANRPRVRALKPYVEVFVPEDAASLERSPVIVREFLSEAELRNKVITEGWNEEWVEAALELKGGYSAWQDRENKGLDSADWSWQGATEEGDKVEVLTAYTWRVDGDGVPGIYVTIFHPLVGGGAREEDADLCAKHGLLDYEHGEMPFVYGSRERTDRPLTGARGVPNVAAGWQRERKVQRDAIIDRTSFSTLPPVLIADEEGLEYTYGPASRIPVRTGKEPAFMQPPRSDGTAELVEARIDQECADYFGLPRKDGSTRPVPKLQKLVNRYLLMWRLAFRQVWQLIEQYAPDAELARIAGRPVARGRERGGKQYDFILGFDVRELDHDLMQEKLEAISAMLPEDAAGVIDRAKFVELKLQAIDPDFAELLITPQAQASQALFNQVREEIGQMFLGNAPNLVEMDPTAEQKLKYAQMVIQGNPNYQQALLQGAMENRSQGRNGPVTPAGRFAALMETYGKNLAFSVMQQQNKMVGRIGVNQNPPGRRTG